MKKDLETWLDEWLLVVGVNSIIYLVEFGQNIKFRN